MSQKTDMQDRITKLQAQLDEAHTAIMTMATQKVPVGPTIPNMEQWAAQLDSQVDEDEEAKFVRIDGMLARIEEIWGTGWSPPDAYSGELHPSQCPPEDE